MAEGFLRHHGGALFRSASAGLAPLRRVDPLATSVMRRRGIDIAAHRPRSLGEPMAARADRTILLVGDGEAVGPLPFPGRFERWPVEDPLGWPADVYEDVRDEIERQVRTLVEPYQLAGRGPGPTWTPPPAKAVELVPASL